MKPNYIHCAILTHTHIEIYPQIKFAVIIMCRRALEMPMESAQRVDSLNFNVQCIEYVDMYALKTTRSRMKNECTDEEYN